MKKLSIPKEFFESGEDNLLKKRFNAATDSYFKAIVTLCDHNLEENQGVMPKNHNDRFELLKINYPNAYTIVSELFSRYRKTYNQKADEEDAKITKEKLKEIIRYFKSEKDFEGIF